MHREITSISILYFSDNKSPRVIDTLLQLNRAISILNYDMDHC